MHHCVLNSASSDPESCPVHCQWGRIAILGLNYPYNHCHIPCCCFHNNKLFLVYKIYKIKNIIIFIFDQTFLICYRLFLIRWKLVSKFQYHFPQTFWGVFIQIVKLIVGIVSPSAIVCVCVCTWFLCGWNVSSQYVQILFYNYIIIFGMVFFLYFFYPIVYCLYVVLCC